MRQYDTRVYRDILFSVVVTGGRHHALNWINVNNRSACCCCLPALLAVIHVYARTGSPDDEGFPLGFREALQPKTTKLQRHCLAACVNLCVGPLNRCVRNDRTRTSISSVAVVMLQRISSVAGDVSFRSRCICRMCPAASKLSLVWVFLCFFLVLASNKSLMPNSKYRAIDLIEHSFMGIFRAQSVPRDCCDANGAKSHLCLHLEQDLGTLCCGEPSGNNHSSARLYKLSFCGNFSFRLLFESFFHYYVFFFVCSLCSIW